MSTLSKIAGSPPRRTARRLEGVQLSPREPLTPAVQSSPKSRRASRPLPLPQRALGVPDNSVVRQLPTQRSRPLWLRWLMRAQRSSLVVAFGLIVAALAVYSSTVYTQQIWGQEHGKLKKMQRYERQMVAASEGLKTQLAEQAGRPESGLVPKTLDNMVVIPASAPRSPRPLPVVVPTAPPPADRPLGY